MKMKEGKKSQERSFGTFFQQSGTTISLVIVYIIICIIFTFLSEYFLTVKNFLNIGTYASITGVMAAGVTVAMLLGHIDMSQYATLTIATMTVALMLQKGMPAGLTILAAAAVGVLCGIINGGLIAVFKIPGIIVTMGTMQVFRGIAYLTTNGNTVMIHDSSFGFIGKGYVFGTIPFCIVLMAAVFLMIAYILKYTNFGRKIFAVGGNEQVSYLSGIRTGTVKFLGMVISGVCAAAAGLITCSQVGAAIPSTGTGSEMEVLSAVILGGVSLSGGKGKISGTVIGVLILATIQNGMTLLSLQSFYQMIINGSVLILAVLLDVIKSGALKRE